MDWRTWAPFRSKKVREICEHMTEAEKGQSLQLGAAWGTWVAYTFAGPLGLLAGLWVMSKLAVKLPIPYPFPFNIPWWLPVSVIAILLIILIPAGIRFRKKQNGMGELTGLHG